MIDDKFRADIARADAIERKAISAAWTLSRPNVDDILWTDDSATPVERRKRDFRLILEGVEVKFEVKADFKFAETGNIALEFECWDKPSGLAATGSDVWIHMVPFSSYWAMYYAGVQQLREALMLRVTPKLWRPNNHVKGVRFLDVRTNAASKDSNPTKCMILVLDRHVRGQPWWVSAGFNRKGSVDWRQFKAA